MIHRGLAGILQRHRPLSRLGRFGGSFRGFDRGFGRRFLSGLDRGFDSRLNRRFSRRFLRGRGRNLRRNVHIRVAAAQAAPGQVLFHRVRQGHQPPLPRKSFAFVGGVAYVVLVHPDVRNIFRHKPFIRRVAGAAGLESRVHALRQGVRLGAGHALAGGCHVIEPAVAGMVHRGLSCGLYCGGRGGVVGNLHLRRNRRDLAGGGGVALNRRRFLGLSRLFRLDGLLRRGGHFGRFRGRGGDLRRSGSFRRNGGLRRDFGLGGGLSLCGPGQVPSPLGQGIHFFRRLGQFPPGENPHFLSESRQVFPGLFQFLGNGLHGIPQEGVHPVLGIGNARISRLHRQRKAHPAKAQYQRQKRGNHLHAHAPVQLSAPEHGHARRPQQRRNQQRKNSV